MLLEGRWFDSLGLHVKATPDVLVGTLHGSHRHQCMNVYINY